MSAELATIKDLQARLIAELPSNAPHVSPEPPSTDATQPTKRDEMTIQDVSRRHESLVQLIYHNDRKAVQLIGIYFAIAGAISTLLVANIQTVKLPMAIAAVAVLLCIFFGIVSAFRAHWTTQIYLTGMKPDFWQWSRVHAVSASELIDEYLLRSTESLDANEKVNDAASRHLKRAYTAGITATATAIAMIALTVIASSLCRVDSLAVAAAPLCRLW